MRKTVKLTAVGRQPYGNNVLYVQSSLQYGEAGSYRFSDVQPKSLAYLCP